MFEAYRDVNSDFIFWMEQMREKPLRHPAYQVEGDNPKERWERAKTGMSRAWSTAPVLIVILGDGRRQWGTVQGALTFGRHQSHLTDALANAATLMHLAAASLGLGLAARHDPHRGAVQARAWRARPGDDPSHRSGRLAGDATGGRGARRPLEDVVHYDRYDMKKYMSNEQIIEFLRELRGLTRRGYHDEPKPPGG